MTMETYNNFSHDSEESFNETPNNNISSFANPDPNDASWNPGNLDPDQESDDALSSDADDLGNEEGYTEYEDEDDL